MKLVVQDYKKSITDSEFWNAEIVATLWDFYVTKSVAASASQKRTTSDYGLQELPYEELLDSAGIATNRREMLMADSMNTVLKEYDFIIDYKDGSKRIPQAIDIDESRIICMQPYSIADRKAPEAKISRPKCLLTHIRNAFAHGNTYWLPNRKVLLRDLKDGTSGKITAMMLFDADCLVQWIKMIDKNGRFYFGNEKRKS